jgi:hypothetical protein
MRRKQLIVLASTLGIVGVVTAEVSFNTAQHQLATGYSIGIAESNVLIEHAGHRSTQGDRILPA